MLDQLVSTPSTTARTDVPPAAKPGGWIGHLGLKSYWVAGGLPALVLIAAGVAWWASHGTVPVRFTTAAVTQGNVTRTVSGTGTVNPELTIIVGSYVSGVIQRLYCDYNTQVKAGQVCAKIDPRPFQSALDQYSGQLARDQAILDKDRANLTRYQKLAAQDSIARQQAEDQFYLVDQDEGTVKLDEGLVEGAKLNLEYTDIVSPVDGTVVSRNVTQGQTVAASFQTPTLFLIATDLQKMQVDTNTSESDIGGVKEGDKATFTVDAYPKRIFEGTVTQVRQSPQTVQNVVTFDAVVSVANTDLALMPGMTASTRIIVDQRANVVRVPNQALRYAPGGMAPVPAGEARVWVLRDGGPVAVPVATGVDDESFTEIVKGDLRPGEQVIVGEDHGAAGRSGLPQPRL
ncbi:MAG TPA: efflux RND transporter periplasmic adaptor subunit [Alphaproteobacteria bacterium]|nr:efflux RND transporter periplasmic adaptor subunit [Alphaproteobacteria bacterium]